MNKILKGVVTTLVGLAMTTSVLSLTACGDNSEEIQQPAVHTHTYSSTLTGDGLGHHYYVSTCDEEGNHGPLKKGEADCAEGAVVDGVCDECHTELPVKKTALDLAKEEYDEIVAKMALTGKYVYSITQNSETRTYKIDGKKVENDDYSILYSEGEDYFRLDFDYGDQKYHKTETTSFDVESYVLTDMQNATIKAYDESRKLCDVMLGGENFAMSVNGEDITFTRTDKTLIITEVGTATVDFPSSILIVDETAQKPGPEIPDEPNPPVVEKDKIYTVSGQTRVYDKALLADTIKTALNTTKTGETETLYEKLTFNSGVSVDEVLYANAKNGTIEVAVLGTLVDGATAFHTYTIQESALGSLNSKETWVNKLVADDIVKADVIKRIEYSTKPGTENADKVQAAMENSLERLAAHGSQTDLNVEGEATKNNLSGAEVVFAFTTENTTHGVGHGFGDTSNADIYGIVKTSAGDYVYLDLDIIAERSLTKTPLETVATQINKFIVEVDVEKTLDKDFFASKTQTKEVANVAGKGKGE